MLVAGKSARKFPEVRIGARCWWGMTVEEGVVAQLSGSGGGGGSGGVGLTVWVERDQSKGRRRSRRRRRRLVSFLDLP